MYHSLSTQGDSHWVVILEPSAPFLRERSRVLIAVGWGGLIQPAEGFQRKKRKREKKRQKKRPPVGLSQGVS